ncbi:hypothetical protein [Desulfurivibrio dismutans]|uniref:hypothetical protein n=1 Tax=Desulfurivibrio dismutans TaxID=1398908 RepID=UPI0023DAE7E4|nr:hypothetical protein [Desulfurivibrio alkaliphilus]MDF1614072.1 hypothetical protein [Desulfurivibrio alkaliphilus]
MKMELTGCSPGQLIAIFLPVLLIYMEKQLAIDMASQHGITCQAQFCPLGRKRRMKTKKELYSAKW